MMAVGRCAWVTLIGTVAAASVACNVAHAQTTPVYRCGSVYTQWPCSPESLPLRLSGPPDASARESSARTVVDEARWAERMRVERVAGEARARPAQAVSIGPKAPGPALQPAPRRSGKQPTRHASRDTQGTDFVASVPAPAKVRKSVN